MNNKYYNNDHRGHDSRGKSPSCVSVKAPFNFVPLADKVYFPQWANQVSQDIPFRDGICGTIELCLTSQSPIFVRNGHTQEMANGRSEEYKSFSRTPDNRYFIPATTIKGCIRNVLEIMSFGKMTQVQDASFGLRDLNDSTYRSDMKNISCGWLKETSNGYILYDWGEPGRISIEAIDKHYNTELAKFVKGNNFNEDSENKTARYKYMQTHAESACETAHFEKDDVLQKAKEKANKIEPRKFYKFGGKQEGVLVFTGQPSQRKQKEDKKSGKLKWTGKYYEFVFLKPDRENTFEISEEKIKAFKAIHAESSDYKDFWSAKLRNGERIPVFFKKNGDQIHSIGIAYMYKYPYKKSLYDAIPQNLKNPQKTNGDEFRMDLSECMFGYALNEQALKGRIHFGHAFANGQPTPLADRCFVSATPHPSYYPLYVKDGKDWNKANIISGRKRYPTRAQVMNTNENVGTKNMEQVCSMLNKGVTFVERISFHNLKKVELGALLSALTFHGMNDKCFHNLGFGKAYGYGKVQVSAITLNFTDTSIKECLTAFEDEMEGFTQTAYSGRWLATTQMKELVAMAMGIPTGMDNKFQYLKMSTKQSENEFSQVKKDNQSLGLFTSITGKAVEVRSAKEMEEPVKKESILANNPKNEAIEEVAFTPTDLKVGQIVAAECIKEKCVKISGYEYDIQLTIPKGHNASEYVGKSFNVEIKQISKAGKICQVSIG